MKKTFPTRKLPVGDEADGKLPPHDDALERALLGAVLLFEEALPTVQNIVQPTTFYNHAHRIIWEAILALADTNTLPDVLTVVNQLRITNQLQAAGGPMYLSNLTANVGYLKNVVHISHTLVEKHMLRQMIDNAQRVLAGAYQQADPFDLLTLNAQTEALLNRQLIGGSPILTIKQAITNADEILQHARLNGHTLSGVSVGFTAFDAVTGGLQPGELCVLAARPGMGKTALALQMARNAAVNQGVPTAIFSLEMPIHQLTNRLQAAEAKLPLEGFKNACLTDVEFNSKNTQIQQLVNAPLYIDDTAALTIAQLCARAKHLHHKYKLGFIVIDYLQLITPADRNHNTNREQDIAHISRSLKLLAKELGIPILALSQLSRAVEGRNSKRPTLSDLRESGAIEQDADMVAFIYRPGYYRIANNANNQPYPHGYTELTIAKHRNGALTDVALCFNATIQHFAPAMLLDEF